MKMKKPKFLPDCGKVVGAEANAIPFMLAKPTLEQSAQILKNAGGPNLNPDIDTFSIRYEHTTLYVYLED